MSQLGPSEWAAIELSLRIAVIAALASLPFAVWVAHLLARKSFRGRWAVNAVVHLPLVLPPVVTGYLLLVVFGRNGWVGGILHDVFGITLAFRWTGAALAAGIMAFPLMVRALRLGFEAVDADIEIAASTLGAGRLRVLRTVTLPLILPSMLAALVLGFAKALGEFGATITFVAAIPGQTQTIPSAIYGLLQVPGQEPVIVWLVGISIVFSIGALVLSEWLATRLQRGRHD